MLVCVRSDIERWSNFRAKAFRADGCEVGEAGFFTFTTWLVGLDTCGLSAEDDEAVSDTLPWSCFSGRCQRHKQCRKRNNAPLVTLHNERRHFVIAFPSLSHRGDTLSTRHVIINLRLQRLTLFESGASRCEYPVSSASNGPGEQTGSGCTPRGLRTARALIGRNFP